MDTPPSQDRLSAALRREGFTRRYRRGQALFTEGDRAERVFLVDSGWVLITTTSGEGREIVLGLRGSGEIIGEMSTLDGAARSATAMAVGEVEAVVAPGSVLTRALDDPQAARELIQLLATRLRDADRKRMQLATQDTLTRVADRLLELSDGFGEPTEAGIAVELPFSKEQLASWCGASRESTVKALATLRSLNTISTGRQSMVIHDLAALRGHAGRTG